MDDARPFGRRSRRETPRVVRGWVEENQPNWIWLEGTRPILEKRYGGTRMEFIRELERDWNILRDCCKQES